MFRTAALVLVASCSLPPPPPALFVTPQQAPAPIEVCWLETGGRDTLGGFGTAGLTQASTWQVTTSALLVRHPKGDVLIDTGMSENVEHDASELVGWSRFVFNHTAGSNEPSRRLDEQLADLKAQPIGIVLSHAHADHAGGLGEVPQAPIWVAKEELDLARTNLEHGPTVIPRHARAILERGIAIPFTNKRWAIYPQHWDVFGDGSLVIVPTKGHTPGSVSTFINLGTTRLFHVGDLINLQESISRAVPKSLAMRTFTDDDVEATNLEVAKLVELQRVDPSLWILPAHDRQAWEAVFGPMPRGALHPVCVSSSTL